MVRQIPRRLARAPIAVFRAGLGWIFGGVLVMVEHRGRTSGRLRHVVLEAVDSDAGSVLVAAGYGRGSQWFRNIETDPRVRVWRGLTAGRRALAEVLPPGEVVDVLTRYRDAHPLRARFLAPVLGLADLVSGEVGADVGERVPLVRLRYLPHAHA